jgi:dienelactone hydrolase
MPSPNVHWGERVRLEGGIEERSITVDRGAGPIPGLLWTKPGGGRSPLVLVGHGGSGKKDAANNLAIRDFLTGQHGIATLAIDGPAHGDRGPVTDTSHPAYTEMWKNPRVIDEMNEDWRATLDAALALGEFDPGAIGYYGLSMGTMFGLPLVAFEPRIAVAVLGLCGVRGTSIDRSGIAARLAADAPRITCPLMYHVQWDDERFERESAFELYGMLASTDKRLQTTPGLHAGVGVEARDTLQSFLAARLQALHAPSAVSAR